MKRYIFIIIFLSGCTYTDFMSMSLIEVPEKPTANYQYSEVRDESRYYSSFNAVVAGDFGSFLHSQSMFTCNGKGSCEPEYFLFSISVEWQHEFFTDDMDLALLVGDNRIKYYPDDIIVVSGPTLLQVISFKITTEEFIEFANHENVKGELGNLPLDFSYANRANHRYLIRCMEECETEEFDLPFDY